MSTFDILVVGSGGGPDETDLSAYLLKPSDTDWKDGVIGLEAGSGVGSLRRILQRDPSLLGNAVYAASEIYSFITCFLISHAHLDHISGLILSAGSLSGCRKRVYASKDALDIVSSAFNDRLWPSLASFDEEDDQHKLLLCPLRFEQRYINIHPSISVLPLPLSHGTASQNRNIPVLSTAFFLRHESTQKEILFFGDVEPDALALTPLNMTVWRTAAPKIPHALAAIFIECSWTAERSDDMLYGHLNPSHLVDELTVLATEVWKIRSHGQSRSPPRKRKKSVAESMPVRSGVHQHAPTYEDLHGVLDGLSVYIIHCKSDFTRDRPIRHIIAEQVNVLVREKGLGARILAIDQGSLIRI